MRSRIVKFLGQIACTCKNLARIGIDQNRPHRHLAATGGGTGFFKGHVHKAVCAHDFSIPITHCTEQAAQLAKAAFVFT